MLPVVVQLTATLVQVYKVTAPADRAVIRMVRAVNNDVADRTYNVKVQSQIGTALQFSSLNQVIPVGQMSVDTDEIELRYGDSLWALCSSAGKVDMFISGYEMDREGRRVLPE